MVSAGRSSNVSAILASCGRAATGWLTSRKAAAHIILNADVAVISPDLPPRPPAITTFGFNGRGERSPAICFRAGASVRSRNARNGSPRIRNLKPNCPSLCESGPACVGRTNREACRLPSDVRSDVPVPLYPKIQPRNYSIRTSWEGEMADCGCVGWSEAETNAS